MCSAYILNKGFRRWWLGLEFQSRCDTFRPYFSPNINSYAGHVFLASYKVLSIWPDRAIRDFTCFQPCWITLSVTLVRYGVYTRNTHIHMYVYEQLFGGYASFRCTTLNDIILLKTIVLHIFLRSERKIIRHRSPGISRIQTLGWDDPVWTSAEPRFRLGFVPTSGLDTPISQVNDDGLFMSYEPGCLSYFIYHWSKNSIWSVLLWQRLSICLYLTNAILTDRLGVYSLLLESLLPFCYAWCQLYQAECEVKLCIKCKKQDWYIYSIWY